MDTLFIPGWLITVVSLLPFFIDLVGQRVCQR